MTGLQDLENRLERILLSVQKPGRYVGGELNSIVKDWNQIPTRVALSFPDIYDIGLPNLGLAILYDTINSRVDALAERTYLPWIDMESAMRNADIPLYSLESKQPINKFDILAITLPYETLYTNVLTLLDLAKIPIYSKDRDQQYPLVIAGGHATYNPEPMAPFIDAFAIGEGEEMVHEIINTYQDWKKSNAGKTELFRRLANISGVYVPSFYEPIYNPDRTLAQVIPIEAKAPAQIIKRIVPKLPPPPTRLIVPSIDVVHNRIVIEIMRGCTRGCRFCHAGMVTRPVRERPVPEIFKAVQGALDHTGIEEVAFLSLSSSDYTNILELVDQVSLQSTDNHLVISLPSLRIESFSVDLMEKLKGSRQGGFTLAPEAATEKIRNTINKPISNLQLLETVRGIYSRGWTNIKLYFMIGHPMETLEDVKAIVNLCQAVIAEGRKVMGRRATLHAGISTFVPKPHTPFQWVPCDTIDQIQEKQNFLKRELRGPGLKLTWNNPYETLLEAWLSRGDRRMAEVIFHAWQNGAKFDAWQDMVNFLNWRSAFETVGIDPTFYTHRERGEGEVFPWDHIFSGVRKAYLLKEYQASKKGKLTEDCREGCYACGILPTFADSRRQYPGKAWECPDVSQPQSTLQEIQVN